MNFIFFFSWVHKFLDPPLNGLDVLIAYLENSLSLMRDYEQFDSFDFLNNPNVPALLNSTSPFLHPTIFRVNCSLSDMTSPSNCKLKKKRRKYFLNFCCKQCFFNLILNFKTYQQKKCFYTIN